MDLNNITNITGNIIYEKIFKENQWIKKSYDLFLNTANSNDPMKDSLMHFYFKKYNENPISNYIFIPEEYMDIYVENNQIGYGTGSTYPSNMNHNCLLFCGYEDVYNKLWYLYFDISDQLNIFVDPLINLQFKNSYLLDKYLIYEEEKVYFNKIKTSENSIMLGFFYTENKGFTV